MCLLFIPTLELVQPTDNNVAIDNQYILVTCYGLRQPIVDK